MKYNLITRSEYDENIKTDYMDNIKMLKNVYFKTIRNKKKKKRLFYALI